LHNTSDQEVGVELSIDGVNTLAKSQDDELRQAGKYVVLPRSSAVITGWYHGSTRDPFTAAGYPRRPAPLSSAPDADEARNAEIGSITAVFCEAKRNDQGQRAAVFPEDHAADARWKFGDPLAAVSVQYPKPMLGLPPEGTGPVDPLANPPAVPPSAPSHTPPNTPSLLDLVPDRPAPTPRAILAANNRPAGTLGAEIAALASQIAEYIEKEGHAKEIDVAQVHANNEWLLGVGSGTRLLLVSELDRRGIKHKPGARLKCSGRLGDDCFGWVFPLAQDHVRDRRRRHAVHYRGRGCSGRR
jgi:hypothetical protein